MKIKFEDLINAINKIEKISNKGDVSISFNEYNSALEFSFWTNLDTNIKISLYASELEKFATITETDILSTKK